MHRGILQASVMAGYRKPKATRAERLEEEEEDSGRVLDDQALAALWRATGTSQFGQFARLVMLTGVRKGEGAGLCWSHLDLERGTW